MRNLRIIVYTAALFLLVACGIDNTMYNAKNYFKSAQERPLSANGRPTPQAVDEYTKTIQKCGIILTRNSTGKRADDALFLMARALYYKKNSAFQAKDAFESLITGYPKSKHIPDANIYLARILREINQAAQSEAVLEGFVRNPKYIKHHPRALLLLADFEISDEDYIRAQYWLQRIMNDYGKTKEAKEAFFLIGKNYYMQKDYNKSLEEFRTFIDTRGIPKEKKLEAHYYIAINMMMLQQYVDALKEIRYVVRNETRPDMLSRAKVLYGRILLANGEEEDGLEELESVTKTYSRTEHSAAAYYYWGRYLYYTNNDHDTAVTYLNKVRAEFSTSEYSTLGNQLASAITQSTSGQKPSNSNNLQQFLDYYYQRAESFLGAIALPDSALMNYQFVIAQRDSFAIQIDSLSQVISEITAQIDSLEFMLSDSLKTVVAESIEDSLATVMPDSLSILLEETDTAVDSSFAESPEIVETITEATELNVLEATSLPDSTTSVSIEEVQFADSLNTEEIIEPKPDIPDAVTQNDLTLDIDNPQSAEHAESPPETPEKALSPEELYASINTLERRLETEQKQLEELNEILRQFDTEILPFCYYSMFTIQNKISGREDETEEIHQTLIQRFPRSLYTAAANAVVAGKKPTLTDPDWEEAEIAFDAALEMYPDNPDSLISAMQDFIESEYSDLSIKANYRLGWHYSFEAPDTTLAKTYLNVVLEYDEPPEYKQLVLRFYDGQKFLKRESDYSYIQVPDSLLTADPDSLNSTEPIELDSLDMLSQTTLVDSLSIDTLKAEIDSLDIGSSPQVEDSLSVKPSEAINNILDIEEKAALEDSLTIEKDHTLPTTDSLKPDSLDVLPQVDSNPTEALENNTEQNPVSNIDPIPAPPANKEDSESK